MFLFLAHIRNSKEWTFMHKIIRLFLPKCFISHFAPIVTLGSVETKNLFIYIGIKRVPRFRNGLSKEVICVTRALPERKLWIICLKLMIHQPFITHVISLGKNRCHFNVLDINFLHSVITPTTPLLSLSSLRNP